MSILWEFEDKMDSVQGLFYNGIRNTGGSSARESYGTVMNFEKMRIFLEEHKNDYTQEEWENLATEFKMIGRLSPMNNLVYTYINRICLS